MNKLGTVHSGYDPILPIGKKLCLRVMLEDYRKGDFFIRRRCDYEPWASYVYLSKRTYGLQIKQAISEGVEEIYLVLDTSGNDFTDMDIFLRELYYYIRYGGFFGNIIVSDINEPLEHLTVPEIHSLNGILSRECQKYDNVYFAAGEMATNFYDYYRSYLNCGYKYDYISFHTDYNCDPRSLLKFLALFPKGTKFINNEHYYYAGAEHLGYNNTPVVRQLMDYTKYMLGESRIKSIYVCMPYHTKGKGRYPFLGLNKVDLKDNQVYETVAWKALKAFDYKGGELMKLRELKMDDKGFDVRALQHCLKVTMKVPLKADGWFGKQTQSALENYNTGHNIPNLSVCSLSTWYELLQDINCEMYMSDMFRILEVT